MTAPWRVLGCKGCGSTIVEAALTLAGIPYEREEADYDTEAGHARLIAAGNGLAQVPTVFMPDGTVMTESAALVLHIDSLVPSVGLVPRDPQALRWLVFFVTAIYPTFTYGDSPQKWATIGSADLRTSTDEHRMKLWMTVEAAARGPFFLGDAMSALDIYIAVMTHWRPRRDWFDAHCPRLYAIATALDADSRLAAVWRANF